MRVSPYRVFLQIYPESRPVGRSDDEWLAKRDAYGEATVRTFAARN